MENLLIVGSGGREHALAWKLHRDVPDATVHVAPGNPGTEQMGEDVRNVDVPSSDLDALADFAETRSVDLTVVGPEAPLAAGLADVFAERGLPVFGPGRDAARIESSKAFAKELMQQKGVPTAEHRTFREAGPARDHLERVGAPVVVKASGLAAGKGAYVCDTVAEAREAVDEIMVQRKYGEAGDRVVVEECLEGDELSVLFLSDGERAVPLVPSRDYKQAWEGDEGPNTGGMGAYAPVAAATPELVETVRREVVGPVLEGLAERGTPYHGVLYAGLMLTESGPRVLEFNCRFGDPEAQVILPLTGASLAEPMRAVASGGTLRGWRPETSSGAALITVLASGGYPRDYQVGRDIEIPGEVAGPNRLVFHAGTDREDGRLVTGGGRVLGVVGLGDDLEEAAALSREGADRIRFEGKQWRSDIGHHELSPDATGA